jgi:hypothetical protein
MKRWKQEADIWEMKKQGRKNQGSDREKERGK